MIAEPCAVAAFQEAWKVTWERSEEVMVTEGRPGAPGAPATVTWLLVASASLLPSTVRTWKV